MNVSSGDSISDVKQALTDLQHGKFILVFDNESREGETDFVMAARQVTPAAIRQMRKDGGGLIILITPYTVAQRLQLPFLADLFSEVGPQYPVLRELTPNDIPYDTKSSFSLSINHRKTFTGITDNDRSLTMRKFADLVKTIETMDSHTAVKLFGKEFRSPGHIPICIAAEKLLKERKGHTELVVALLQMAGLIPAGSGCEIMGDSGKALSKEDAQRYAEKNGLTFLEGKDIVRSWNEWLK
ncbi:MAG TPA: 3,4-dihydroxy-2-butanone-4-phosphate synthase [Candidatus Thermoplasmatota archaeon]|nr:3,4-dihydroxy-2-butanone-4-phosphate synthase [Candidatus Thermoplasmatota archaeon]